MPDDFRHELEKLKKIELTMPSEVCPEGFGPIIGYGVIHLVGMQNFQKTNIFYPLIRTCTCAYHEVRNVSSSENFAYVLNG